MPDLSRPPHRSLARAPEWPVFLGAARTRHTDWGAALAAALALLVAFCATAPQASRPLPAYSAFAPICDVIVVVLGALAALLLHANYRQSGERAWLVLAWGYVSSAVLLAAHALSCSGAFVAAQASEWLWVASHALFPCFVAAAALAPHEPPGQSPSERPARNSTLERGGLAATLALAALVIVLAAAGGPRLLRVEQGAARAAPWLRWLGAAAHLAALATLLWRSRLRRRIDLWLAVSLLAASSASPLSSGLAPERYTLGFYLGRLFGLIGPSLVLSVLLRHALGLYAAAASDPEERTGTESERRRASESLERRMAEVTAASEAELRARRALALRLATAQEDERKHFARELHDSAGQLIAALALALDSASTSGALPSAAAAPLERARQLVSALGREVHALAVRLRPPALDDVGLAAALDQLVTDWSARTGLPAEFTAAGLAESRFQTEVETTVYRVVQEALTNVARHARAQRAGVVVTRPAGALSVVIEDDGLGFDDEAPPSGRLGLIGMRERADLVGGSLEIESRLGTGTLVTLRIPAAALEARPPRANAPSERTPAARVEGSPGPVESEDADRAGSPRADA